MIPVDELRTGFHQQMGDVEAKIIQLFALVAEDLAAATQALLSGDTDSMQILASREVEIDALYRDIENLVNSMFALQAPVATDLRFLLSVLRIVPELERSHDLVSHIANRADGTLGQELSPRTRGLIERMGAVGTEMWRQAADSWYQRDGAAANRLDERDDEIDTLHAALEDELAKGQMPTQMTMAMTLVGRFYERLGDHAVNIARRVIYLAGSEAPR